MTGGGGDACLSYRFLEFVSRIETCSHSAAPYLTLDCIGLIRICAIETIPKFICYGHVLIFVVSFRKLPAKNT